MWAGTNSGSVFAYALEVPSQEKFSERAVEAVLGKEIQLMHRAPVVAIAVLDGRGNPLPEPYEVSRDLAKAPDMQGSHSMLISSEEQFKVSMGTTTQSVSCVLSGYPHRSGCRDGDGGDQPGPGAPQCLSFKGMMLPFAEGFPSGRLLRLLSPLTPQVFTLPKVSAKTKFKLTAHEGCRVRKVALVSLASASSEERLENCLACLTNLGDIHIFTVPSLRPQVHYGCIRKEDISGIASCVFTKHGQGERCLLEGGPRLLLHPVGVFLRLFGVPCSRFLPDFTIRVRALLTERQERDGAAVPAGGRPAPGHLLPQVGCIPASLYPHPTAPAPAVTSPCLSFQQQLNGNAEAAASQWYPRPAQP